MTKIRVSGGKGLGPTGVANTCVRRAAIAAVPIFFSPCATAQEADLTAELTNGVRCIGGVASQDMQANIEKIASAPEVISSALGALSADEMQCSAIRIAAAELALSPVGQVPQEPSVVVTPADALVSQGLADAGRNADQLKFEVGPPPRNKTSGRGQRP